MNYDLPDSWKKRYIEDITTPNPLLRLLMTNTPQNVTSRYVRNLLVKGENNEYVITAMGRKTNMVDELIIGYYYAVDVLTLGTHVTRMAIGVTPEQAVHRCLTKHGVTFR